ncbi:MAG: hypothetical protein PVF29_16500 [Desulfobacterales bacterium]|jgi:hypothetical protein
MAFPRFQPAFKNLSLDELEIDCMGKRSKRFRLGSDDPANP